MRKTSGLRYTKMPSKSKITKRQLAEATSHSTSFRGVMYSGSTSRLIE